VGFLAYASSSADRCFRYCPFRNMGRAWCFPRSCDAPTVVLPPYLANCGHQHLPLDACLLGYLFPPYLLSGSAAILRRTHRVYLLPMILISIPGHALAGILVSRQGKFKLLYLVGEGVFMLGLDLFAIQWEGSTTAEWAIYQSIGALGGGIVLETLLPAFQAPVPESDQAAATATWAFIRNVGGVWGVALSATIFNNGVDQLVHMISDTNARQLLASGGAYR
jgi:hypothetical protein